MTLQIRQSDRLCIAHVTRSLDIGGQEKMLVEFAHHADRARYEITVVVLEGRGPLADALEAAGARVITLDEPGGLRPRITWRLARLFRSHRFDVVHTHDEKPLLYGVPAARLARVPAVIHTHHHGPLPGVKRRHTVMIALLARWIDRLVCVSQASRDWLVTRRVPSSKTVCLRNGIDLARFAYAGPCPTGPVITVARLSPEKDQEMLLRSVALLRDALPEVRLEIAGDGPRRAALEALSAELGLQNRVRFLGEVQDVPALLARGSVFVLSSLTEGMSLTLLEAMASGLPVVATRVGGNPEVVVDGETGVLVPSGQPEELARALQAVLQDPRRAAQFGLAARKRVESHFDVRRMVAEYEALYARCASRKQKALRVPSESRRIKKPRRGRRPVPAFL
jgi:sugar transferase (PEP-CTERM/EpsH1 system associated)